MARYRKGLGKLNRRTKGGQEVGSYFFKFDGKRITTGTHNRAEAESFRRKFIGDVERGAVSPRAAKITIDALLDLVMREYEQRVREARDDYNRRSKQRARDNLVSRLKRLRPYFGSVDARKLRMSIIDDYVRSRSSEKRKPSPSTINREIETLQHALRLASDQQLITHRWSIPKHREDNVRQGFLDAADYRRLRDSIDDRAVRLMFVIAFHIGWRVGRVLGIRWDDVDLEARIIHPPEGQAANKWVGAARIGSGELRQALVAALVERAEYFADCPWVVHRAGRQVRSYKNAWADATALAGLPGLRVHDLRRSAVRNTDEAGISAAKSQKIIGHKTQSMRQRYRIVPTTDIVAAGEQLDRYLESQMGDGDTEIVH